MMTYTVRSRANAFNRAALALLFSAISLAIGPLSLYGGVTRGAWGSGLISLLIALGSLWFIVGRFREVREISVDETGMVAFARTVGMTRIASRDITRLEGKHASDYDGNQTWYLRVHHAGGRVKVDEFPHVIEFVDRLRELNPAIALWGVWPMTVPPGKVARVAP